MRERIDSDRHPSYLVLVGRGWALFSSSKRVSQALHNVPDPVWHLVPERARAPNCQGRLLRWRGPLHYLYLLFGPHVNYFRSHEQGPVVQLCSPIGEIFKRKMRPTGPLRLNKAVSPLLALTLTWVRDCRQRPDRLER